MTKIEWTEMTWNPIVGCSVTSPGCTNCYAMRQAHRLSHNPATPHYHGTAKMSRGGPVFTGAVGIASHSALIAPITRKKPTLYFVNSMGDPFHENVPDAWIDRMFAVMALAPQHTFQVLTKRAARMREYFEDMEFGRISDMMHEMDHPADEAAIEYATDRLDLLTMPRPLPNVWLGVSVEDQSRADERIPDLLATPAAVRFLSCEPLLGPVDLTSITAPKGTLRPYLARVDALSGCCQSIEHHSNDWFRMPHALDWIICGGESGPGARPMHPDWARSLRNQCGAAGVRFFFKQWGDWAPGLVAGPNMRTIDAAHWWDEKWDYVKAPPSKPDDHIDDEPDVFRIGKKRAGRLLDGRTWDQMPEVGA